MAASPPQSAAGRITRRSRARPSVCTSWSESLLDFGRMEAGVTPYRLEPLDACTLTRSVVEQFEREAATRGYHVELSVDDAVTASVHGDRDALTNALWNLLDNAVKYSPDCRTVWVRVEAPKNHRLAIRVRDRGIGIPPEEQQDILAKFVARGRRPRRKTSQARGLGWRWWSTFCTPITGPCVSRANRARAALSRCCCRWRNHVAHPDRRGRS